MKTDFKYLKDFKIGQIFYLYGNYRNSFDVLCDFVVRRVKNDIPNIQVRFCSPSDFEKLQNSQCDLFGNEYFCYCIRGIEDRHIEKVMNFPRDRNIFILESGDYSKSKKVTAAFTKDPSILACPSFDSDMTFQSLCQMLLPKRSAAEYSAIIQIMKSTDENLLSLFTKLELIQDDNLSEHLKQYVSYRRSFVSDLDFIPFTRYALQAAMKENIFYQNQSYTKMDLAGKINFLLDAEVKQKLNGGIGKSYLYQKLR